MKTLLKWWRMRYEKDRWLMDTETRMMVRETITALQRADRLARMPRPVREAEAVRSAKQGS